METKRGDIPGPAPEWNGYSYNDTDTDKKLRDEKRRLYPTPRQDAEYAAMGLPVKPVAKAKRKPAGF